MRVIARLSMLALSGLILAVLAAPVSSPPGSADFTFQEVMIPMRDGARLQTVILAPRNHTDALPILMRRTPYGVPQEIPKALPDSFKLLAMDGYVFVIQNLRGRFKSEGVFKLSSQVNLSDPRDTNETTDA